MVAKNVEHLNQQLAVTERNVIRFGIGINGGEVIIGDVGHGENIAFTALGDAVNVAARLQDMSKELECEVVISDEVYQTAGLPLEELQRKEITVRGRTAPIVVRTVLKAENLATLFERTTAGSVAAPRRRTVRENL
jgi:adenylate cyclase